MLPSTAPLTGVFAPTSDQSWLSIGSITNGFIDFSFAANTSTTTLTAHITVLGQTITVTQNGLTSQTISFGALPNQVYGSAPFMVSATASSGLTVTFVSATPSVCSVSGAIVTLIQAGTCTIQATQAGDTDFAPAPTVTQGFQVTQATPTVAFTGAPASAPFRSTFTVVAATNASTTAVISVSGPCSISGTTVTITAGSGTCVLTATWAADNNYTAGSATQSTVATKATPTISWPTPAPITYGTPLTAAQLDATATYNKTPVPGSFAYTPPAGTVLMAGAETLSVKFTPKIAGYSDATGSVTLQVNQARPKTIWPKPAAIPYGTASKQHATGRLIPGGRSFRLFAARWNRAARRDPHAFGRIFAD